MEKLPPGYNTVAVSLFLLLVISSCDKHQEESPNTPTSSPGSISGRTSPENAAFSVVATGISGGKTTTLDNNNSDGTFKFQSVIPGAYKISVIPKVGYDAPADVQVAVESGKNTSAGKLTLTPNGQVSTIAYTFDGIYYTINSPQAASSYIVPNFRLVGETSASPSYWSISIDLKAVNGTGVYSTTTSESFILVEHFSNEYVVDGAWTTNNGGSGEVKITELNTTTHVATGTFTAWNYGQWE